MRGSNLKEILGIMDNHKGENSIVIINDNEIDAVHCFDKFNYTIEKNSYGNILNLKDDENKKSYYEYGGVYLDIDKIVKITLSGETIYIYIGEGIVKVKFPS